MHTVLITGASRGIGLEFASQYSSLGWRVLATCRDPQSAASLRELQARYPLEVILHPLDVGDQDQIERCGLALRDYAIDVLINNAAWGERGRGFAETSYPSWEQSMRVNAFAILKMAQVFLEHVARSHRKVVVAITSQSGSIAQNTGGSKYAYRASKAAANMVAKTLAVDLAPRGIIVVSLHPGWVKTDLGGHLAPLTTSKSVRGMRQVIDRLTAAESGRFFNYDGGEIPW
jgi:NAD(P)-dependent dehydrogenase (short-subunit alcohol dehydrogenase family)